MNANSNNVILEIHKPINDIVIKGGIFVPNKYTENNKLLNATIISIGNNCKLGFKKTDKVLVDKYSINKINNTTYVTNEKNIILIEK